ncbi:ATP-dependent RNA helicase DEAH11, chloroplastic [Linum perenne]
MSATADANQLSNYFFGCDIFHVSGRNFPVDIRYMPCSNEASTSGTIAPYVYEVVRTSKEIHKTEKEGTILAFLTSQVEVEWAYEDQFRIFEEFPGISQSSAEQRAGRAGRTGAGICYRLYTEHDFELMPFIQEPEIRRVHLGIAVLRILALGIKNIDEFNFVDAPSPQAIDMAIRNLVQLDAIRLTVMTNTSSIFCRVGSKDDKIKADCLKVQFCHQSGDLLTLLSVFKEWEAVNRDCRSKWCWDNSINAKAMRRCHESVKEIEECLQRELNYIVPKHWVWSPYRSTEHDKYLKMSILSALVENVAMYSGYDQVGYQVATTGQNVRLHPSCSLQMFAEKPSWVVFGELLSTANDYLVCVTAFDFESLSTLEPPPLFDFYKMECEKLHLKRLTGFGSLLLKRLCGKYNRNLQSLVKCSQSTCSDKRIGIEVNVDQNEIHLFATTENMEKLSGFVEEAVEYERKALSHECMERHLYHGVGFSSSVALLGAGAEIKHLELQKRFLTVEIFLSLDLVDDKELLMFVEKFTSGTICSIHKFSYGQEDGEKQKWGRITFLSPDAAEKACQLDGVEFRGSILKVVPSQTSFGSDLKSFSFPAVRAKVYWPRKYSKGVAFVQCYNVDDVSFMLQDFSQLVIGEKYIRSDLSRRRDDSIVLSGIDKGIYEGDIVDTLRNATGKQIKDFVLLKGDALPNPAPSVCEEALMREISPFMSKQNPNISCCRVQVFPPEPRDAYMRALIIFDGRLHLEAAKALEHLDGKVLPGCLPWQKIKCQQLFHSSLSCCASVYYAIRKHLDSLLASFSDRNGMFVINILFSLLIKYIELGCAYTLFCRFNVMIVYRIQTSPFL